MNNRLIAFFTIAILSLGAVYAQSDSNEKIADMLQENLNSSRQLFSEGRYDSSMHLLKRNLFDSLLSHNDEEVSKIATESYLTAMQQLSSNAQYDSALIYGEIALSSEVLSPLSRCTAMNTITDICYRIGRYSEGIVWAEKTIDFAGKNVENSRSIIFKSYQAMGLIAIEQNKYELAQKYLLFSLKVLGGKADNPYTSLMAVGNMAILHSRFGNYDSSKYYYHLAIDSLKLFKGHSMEYRVPFIRSQIYNNLSGIYLFQKDFETSYEYLRKAYDFLSTKYPSDNPVIIEMEMKLGSVLTETTLQDSAKFFLDRAKKMSLKGDNGGHRFSAEIYYHLGKYYSRKKEFQRSIQYYDSSLHHNAKYGMGKFFFYSRTRLAVLSLDKRLEAYKEIGGEDRYERFLNDTFSEIVNLANSGYPFLSGPDLSSSVKKLTGDIIQGYQSLNKFNSQEEFLNKIITLMEINKSVKLYGQKNYIAALNQLPKEIRDRDKNLRDSLRLFAARPNNEASDSLLLLLSGKLDLLKEEVKKDYPKIFEYKYGGTNYTLEDIQKRLSQNTTLLSFLLSDSTLQVLSLNNMRGQLSSFSIKEIDYKQVINKILADQATEELENLIIIPDGPVWNINFDLLKSPLREGKFLIEDVNIVYGFSVASLFSESFKERNFEGEVLAFSFGEESDDAGSQMSMQLFRNESFNDLPGSLKEVHEISKILNGDYYFGKEASEKNFKEESSNYRILHLAVHGDLSEKSEGLIFFSNGEKEDGRLNFEELYLMELDAELAVLSACNTGSGEITADEGIISLGRAFAYAGVPGLLLSRSEVSDLSTPYIMKFFYEELKAGNRKSEALRKAKIRFLNEIADEHTKKPAFWSPYYILGDDSPIYDKNDNSLITFGLLFAGIFISGLFLFRYYKS